MERFLLEFDLLRTKAEREIQTGFRFPDSFISVLCMGNALLTSHQKTLVVASVQGSLDSYPALAKQMRQILQPVGGTQKEDILMNSPNIMADNVGVDEEDLSYEAWVAYRKAGKGRKGPQQNARSRPKGKGSKMHEQERNGLNRRTGERNRCYGCGSEFHLLPKCPRRPDFTKPDSSAQSLPNYAPRSSFSSIAMDPAPVTSDESPPVALPAENRNEQSFSTSLDSGCQLVCMRNDSVVVLDTGATANLVCFRWLSHHNALLEQRGLPRVSTYPAQARFKFGDGRTGDVCFAADITVGIAGTKGTFTAFVLDADIPALLCKGALEALAGQLDFARNTLTLGTKGIEIPLKVNEMGHYILSVIDFPSGVHRADSVAQFSASFLEWGPPRPRPNLEHGGICLPFTDDGLCSFSPPGSFSACKAVTLGDAREGNNSDPKKIIEKLHVNWGHASA